MGKTIEYSNPLVADKAKDKSQMYGPKIPELGLHMIQD